MPKITINSRTVEVESGSTIFQACEKIGIEIPHFCYHKKLGVAGNCRMCLVEVEKNPKPVASCAMPISEGMVIHTSTQRVKEMRESVMELLLINHPLDCPICDQGGECDLQEQAFRYGKGISKYSEEKRQVSKKYMGPLIETWMNRCIHCTRCVRFANDIAGIEEIAAINRGEDTEITTLEKAITSEISGNLIDVCPVGALTAKPIAYKYRNWELEKVESIDIHDAFGSNTYLCVKNNNLVRILPRENEELNDEWISDKARFAFDGLKYQRLSNVYIRNSEGKLETSTISSAIKLISAKIKSVNPEKIACIAGDLVDMESLFSAKDFFSNINVKYMDANIHNYNLNIDHDHNENFDRKKYLFNNSVAEIKNADLCLIIGANIRSSAPILNAFIGMQVRKNNLKVYRIGEVSDQTYKINELGTNISILGEILNGKHLFSAELEKAKKPIMIIGDSIYKRNDGAEIISLCEKIAKKYNIITDGWNGFNLLHNHVSTVGAIDLGFWTKTSHQHQLKTKSKNSSNNTKNSETSVKEILKMFGRGEIKILYLLESDNIDIDELKNKNHEALGANSLKNPSNNNPIKDSLIVYHGTHGSEICNIADIIIPAPSYVEKSGSYTNMHGLVQKTNKAVKPIGDAMEIWQFMKILAKEIDIELQWNSLESLSISMNEYLKRNINSQVKELKIKDEDLVYNDFDMEINRQDSSISEVKKDFYMTDIICRYSKTMIECSKQKMIIE